MENQEKLKRIAEIMPCTCNEAYRSRGMMAPDCAYCSYAEDLAEVLSDRLSTINPEKVVVKKDGYQMTAKDNIVWEYEADDGYLTTVTFPKWISVENKPTVEKEYAVIYIGGEVGKLMWWRGYWANGNVRQISDCITHYIELPKP